MDIFAKANNWLDKTEYSFVNFLTAISPWAAPLVPASLALYHMRGEILHFETFVSYAGALAIWALGFASLRTTIIFWQNNRKYSSDKSMKKMPLSVPIASFSFYVVTILVLNVVMELPNVDDVIKRITAILFLTLLEIPAGLLIAVRALYAENIKKFGSHAESIPQNVVFASESSTKVSETFGTWRKLTPEQKKRISQMTSVEQIMEECGKEDRTARNWFKWSRQ